MDRKRHGKLNTERSLGITRYVEAKPLRSYTLGLILASTDLYLLIRWDTRYVTSGIGSI